MTMPSNAMLATPYYVLRDGNHRIGPAVVQVSSGIACLPIYGFSDKIPYDNFCSESQLELTPYPLVKGYLQSQVETQGEGLKLVVLDAAGPREPALHAATMEAVLEAQENRTTHVTATHLLRFDHKASVYTLVEVAS
jgi:hypothetical protein